MLFFPGGDSPVARYRKDILAIFLLALLCLLLLAPALLGLRGIFHDDQAMDELPRMYLFARHYQRGIIPLFRPEIWCGARILYSDFYANPYYPPFLPFLLLTDLTHLDGVYFSIYLFPLLLHYFIAALGMYLLARSALKFNRPGSFLAAVFYFLSPALAFSYVWLSILSLTVWMPWFFLIYIRNIKKPGGLLLIAGGVLFSIMIFSSALPYVAYTLLLASVTCAALMVGRWRGIGAYPLWRPPMLLAGYILLGIFLSAVYWLPALGGIDAVKESGLLTYELAAGGEGSLHPLYLISLLVPGLFGGLDGTHLWGLEQVRYWETNMTGGLAVTLLVLLGLILPWALPKGEERRRIFRFLSVIVGLIYILSLLYMLGRHTVFHRQLWNYLPLAGKFPYPIRYRILQCLAAAVLAGLGMRSLLDRRMKLKMIFLRRVVRWYLVLTPVIVAGILFWPPARINKLIGKEDLVWFISSPVLYLVLGIVLIGLIARASSARRFAYLLAILGILDIGYSAYHAVYLSTFNMGGETFPQHRRSRGPGYHPMYRRVMGVLPSYLGDTNLRIASDQPFHDNLQQFGPYHSFMGYDMKPLEPRFREAMEEAYGCELDWNIFYGQHHRYPRARHPSFYNNMSVGFFLSPLPAQPFLQSRYVQIEESPDYYLHFNRQALPRAFTLDRIVLCSAEEAMNELVKGNLRSGVFVEEGNRLAVIGDRCPRGSLSTDYRLPITDNRLPITDYRSLDPGSEEEYLAHFERLQQANPITRLDFSHPNRVAVELLVTEPAMLVLTEIWHPSWEVRVDGRPGNLLRVNYIQRGVYLEPGEHRVEMDFRPRPWRIGAGISLVSWLLLVLAVLFIGGNKLFVQRGRPAGGGNREINVPDDDLFPH